MTLDGLLSYARTLQLTSAQAKLMYVPEVNRLQSVAQQRDQQSRPRQWDHHRPRQTHRSCNNCGGNWPHQGGQQSCPAYNKKCRSCGKLNHFSSVCKSRPSSTSTMSPGNRPQPSHRRSRIHYLDDETMEEDVANTVSTHSDVEYVFATHNTRDLPHFSVNVNGQPFHFLADSGATINLLSKQDFDHLSPKPPLHQSNKRISAYGSRNSIPVIGTFEAILNHANNMIKAVVYVVSSNERPIMSWNTCQALKLLTTINHVKSVQEEYQEQYPSLFTGLGLLNDMTVKLHIDQNVQPVAQRYRRVPFHVRKNIEEQLQKDEEMGVIEKATGPTPWVSPVVVVPKPKQPGKVRVCVDMRAANKAIRRERHATPTLDELKTMLSGAKVFSKLDLNQGYNQLELDEESCYITTFATHKGLYRYRRLFFGVNSASEIFQEVIRQALSDLDGVVNISDDILCYGSSQQEHDANLHSLFQRLCQKGLTLNGDKCVYNKQSLEFLGHVFGENGIKPSQDKLKTILDLPTPTNASEVRSLLGMMNFCGSHHIPNYATLTYELRQLTKKNVPWSWTETHNATLNKLKTALSKSTTLAYFDQRKPTIIYTDGSPVGISAVLTQDGRVIQFASRALTATEQKYSQTEREALAITWACEYFHIYIFGSPFTIYTDHKPLTTMFNNPRIQLSARIERWVMRMQPYEMTVQYRPGFDNPADYLSRHPVHQSPSGREEKIAEEYLHYVVAHSVPKAMTLDEVASETIKDTTLIAVIDAIVTNDWSLKDSNIDIKTFSTLHLCRAELSVTHNSSIILKGRLIVLPKSLQVRAVTIAHSGHQGVVKTTALLREKVWFKGIQRLVETTVTNCLTCQISTPTPAREPLRMSPLPESPWKEVSADFGHLPNGQYILVITDEYSRYPIVDVIDSTSSRSVIPRLDKVFAEFGFPEVLKTDNGPPFNSSDFTQFCAYNGIRHRKITPLWPRANAETERFMRTIKKTIKCATTPNFKQQMYRFLLDYRTTPHSTTGVPPATALFGRNLKTKLPHISERQDDHKMRQRDAFQKAIMKRHADDKTYVQPSDIRVGDPVLLKNHNANKSDPPFQSSPLIITRKKGSMLTAQRGDQRITRNSSFFKKSPRYPTAAEMEPEPPAVHEEDEPDRHTPSNTPHAHTTPNNDSHDTQIPVHLPRRSVREPRLPKKFDNFIMH